MDTLASHNILIVEDQLNWQEVLADILKAKSYISIITTSQAVFCLNSNRASNQDIVCTFGREQTQKPRLSWRKRANAYDVVIGTGG